MPYRQPDPPPDRERDPSPTELERWVGTELTVVVESMQFGWEWNRGAFDRTNHPSESANDPKRSTPWSWRREGGLQWRISPRHDDSEINYGLILENRTFFVSHSNQSGGIQAYPANAFRTGTMLPLMALSDVELDSVGVMSAEERQLKAFLRQASRAAAATAANVPSFRTALQQVLSEHEPNFDSLT